jgi:hypothetical protein
MHFALVIFWLILWGIILILGLALLFALFTRRWKTLGVVVLMLAAIAWYVVSLDPYVRRDVAAAEVMGSYHLDAGFSSFVLNSVNAKDRWGSINLMTDGTFSATHFPTCCIDRSGGEFSSATEPYTTISGKWAITHNKDMPAVEFESTDGKIQWKANLTSGRHLGLTFAVFVGGDFYDVTFERD